MEKDLFELMTKMYGEMQEIGTEVKSIKTDILDMKTDIKDVKTNMIIENDITPKIEALFDGYKQNTEAITRIDNDIKDLTISINELSIKL